MILPIVIPTDPPGPGWTDQLREAQLSLRDVVGAFPTLRLSLCMLCRVPSANAGDFGVVFSSDVIEHILEFPDGQRVRLPFVPFRTAALGLCKSCMAIISRHPIGDPYGVGFARCQECGALILQPAASVQYVWEVDRYILIKQATGRWRTLQADAVFLCLACQQKLAGTNDKWPLSRDLHKGSRGFVRYVLKRPPRGLPVVYDPAATPEGVVR